MPASKVLNLQWFRVSIASSVTAFLAQLALFVVGNLVTRNELTCYIVGQCGGVGLGAYSIPDNIWVYYQLAFLVAVAAIVLAGLLAKRGRLRAMVLTTLTLALCAVFLDVVAFAYWDIIGRTLAATTFAIPS